MVKQRDVIRMSEAEVDAFLADAKSLNVATLDKEGAPHLTTLWFALIEGRLIFETYGSSQKVVNLRRDPRIAALSEAGTSYDQLRGVSIQGRAEIVDAEPRLSALMRLLVDRNHPGQPEEQRAATTAQMVSKRVVVMIHADKVMSWDHRKLALAH